MPGTFEDQAPQAKEETFQVSKTRKPYAGGTEGRASWLRYTQEGVWLERKADVCEGGSRKALNDLKQNNISKRTESRTFLEAQWLRVHLAAHKTLVEEIGSHMPRNN